MEERIQTIYLRTIRGVNYFGAQGKRNKALAVIKDGLREAYVFGKAESTDDPELL